MHILGKYSVLDENITCDAKLVGDERRKIMRALISVSDKTGIIKLSNQLVQLGFEIISTSGTAKTLREAKIPTIEVSDVTGFEEILDGRVKTLHPKIFGGILFDRNNLGHKSDIAKQEIQPIDWVIVNLYPFEKINLENRFPKSEMIEFIDIGGVALLRAAGKNFKDVVVLCDQKDYMKVVQELQENQSVSIETKKMLAEKAFAHTSHYDSMIAKFFREQNLSSHSKTEPGIPIFQDELTIGLRKVCDLQYGENPQQKASLYKDSGGREWGVVHAEKLQGKELSFNNYLDLDSVWQIANSFNLSQSPEGNHQNLTKGNGRVCCAIVKHTNPCGVAIGKNTLESFQMAYSVDPLSAFGGIVGFSSTVDGETAEHLTKTFFECLIAPDYTQDALKVFGKKPNLRVLRQSTILTLPYEIDVKKISGGMLVQEQDNFLTESTNAKKTGELGKVVTKREPTPEEMYSLEFAWKICRFVKSNAIVLARGTVTAGTGAGQMSRIDSLRIAMEKSSPTNFQNNQRFNLKSSNNSYSNLKVGGGSQLPLVMASDAFFPFRDCVDESAKNGITAIIQPGGSIRDQESIDAANEHNIAMIFTKVRHFRH